MTKDLETKASKSIAELEEEAKAERAFLDNLCVLIDMSGSMFSPFANGGSKHEAAQKALDLLYSSTDWSICDMKVFSFDDLVQSVKCSETRKPVVQFNGGGTNFSAALSSALEDVETNRIILCSDGEATYPEREVNRCIERHIPVDTIFIKSLQDYSNAGEELLKRISEETGGQFCTVDTAEALMQAFAALETSERLLLSGPADEVIKL